MQKTLDSVLIDRDEHIELAARALKAISHPLRLKILCVLGDQEKSVQDIVEMVGTTQSNISQHLPSCVTRTSCARARMPTASITGSETRARSG